jgi:subtilisin-like proprotein convertase family protein
MKTVSKLVCIAGLAGLAATASAQVFTYNVNQSIPDGDLNGIALVGTVSGVSGTVETNAFKVSLNIQGDPIAGSGDLYSYLRSPSGEQAILLNRPGYPGNNGVGYQDNGMNIRLFDGVDPNHKNNSGLAVEFTDVHFYQDDPIYGGQPNNDATGIFESDGRDVNPLGSADDFNAASRSLNLNVFQGINPNGDWLLFVADVSSGGSAKLNSWGLDFTPIPEPQEYAMAIGMGLVAFALYRRRVLKAA